MAGRLANDAHAANDMNDADDGQGWRAVLPAVKTARCPCALSTFITRRVVAKKFRNLSRRTRGIFPESQMRS
jgi:hypothetical protein